MYISIVESLDSTYNTRGLDLALRLILHELATALRNI